VSKNTISAQVSRVPAKQGKQNQWKVNHSEGFQRSRNKASKKCTSFGKRPMHGRKDCPASCEGTLRNYVPLKENSPKTGRRRGCHTGCHHSGRFQKENEIEGNSLSQLSGTPRSVHQDPWHANILVNCKRVNFRVDTRADVTVVPRRYFTKNYPLIQKTNKKLFGPGKTKINVVGQFKRH